jgi:hypothetical protein
MRMVRSIDPIVEGFIGASSDGCYRCDLSPADKMWLRELRTGQRVMMLMDLLYHIEMGVETTGPEETMLQNAVKWFEDRMIGVE